MKRSGSSKKPSLSVFFLLAFLLQPGCGMDTQIEFMKGRLPKFKEPDKRSDPFIGGEFSQGGFHEAKTSSGYSSSLKMGVKTDRDETVTSGGYKIQLVIVN